VLVLGVVVAQAVLAVLFGWPAARATPHDLPIAVAGPPAALAGLQRALGAAHPGAFAVHPVGDRAAARAAVTGRRAYAAIVVEPSGISVLTASAASPAVAGLLTAGLPAAIRAHAPGIPVRVSDLAPNPQGDPHGAVPAILLIPLLMTSLAGGALLAVLAATTATRLAGLAALALLAGATTTAAVQPWLGALAGPYLPNAAVLSLTVLAVAATATGLARQLAAAGVALAAVVLFFVGFPLSGATGAPELLPPPWGTVGQALPAGAASTAVRSVAFFAGAGAGRALLVLALWAVGGLALTLLPRAPRAHRTRTAH